MVSNTGDIISTRSGERPFTYIRADGLECINVSKSVVFEVVEIFLFAFSEKPKNAYSVKFRDGNSKNYAISNLEWITYDEDFIENVPGWKGYFVSSKGDVFSLKKTYSREKWKKLNPAKNKDGRVVVKLRNGTNVKLEYLHKLVLLSHVGPRPNGMQCCHNDGNPLNNHVSNLRWDTPKANNADKILHGTHQCGEKANQSKLKEAEVLEIIKSQDTLIELAKRFNVAKCTIYKIKNKQSWTHLHRGAK